MTQYSLIIILSFFTGEQSSEIVPYSEMEECRHAESRVEIPWDDPHLQYYFTACVRTEFIQVHDSITGVMM